MLHAYLLVLGVALQAGTVLDRIAIAVDKHAIKTSDIDRDLRVTQFLNAAPPDFSVAARKASAQRLIDQELIRSEIAVAGNTAHLDGEANALYEELRKTRFGGVEAQIVAELKRRGLTKKQLLDQLQWQLVVLQFIDQRFRPGVLVTDEEVKTYYEANKARLAGTLESSEARIRSTIEGERIDRNFEDWLAGARKNVRIEYKVDGLK